MRGGWYKVSVLEQEMVGWVGEGGKQVYKEKGAFECCDCVFEARIKNEG